MYALHFKKDKQETLEVVFNISVFGEWNSPTLCGCALQTCTWQTQNAGEKKQHCTTLKAFFVNRAEQNKLKEKFGGRFLCSPKHAWLVCCTATRRQHKRKNIMQNMQSDSNWQKQREGDGKEGERVVTQLLWCGLLCLLFCNVSSINKSWAQQSQQTTR